VSSDDTLPEIAPTRVNNGRIGLAPTSINFIALPRANNASCRA
jgi:heparanase